MTQRHMRRLHRLLVRAAWLMASSSPLGRVHAQAPGTSSGEAVATTLALTPANPRPGQPFHLRYRGTLSKGQPRTLVVRARFRTVNSYDDPRYAPAERLGRLRRERDGSYSGRIQLPDSVPYAALAIATEDGTRVDDNGARAWPLLTGDSTGAPTFRARVLHANDYLGRNFPRAFAEMHAAVAVAPDSVWGWYLLDFYGQVQYGQRYLDSVRTDRLARLATLEQRHGAAAGGLEAYAFQMVARFVRDTSRMAVWEHRFLGGPPTFSYQREMQADALVQRLRRDPAKALDSLEAYWATMGVPERGVALSGVRLAIRAADATRLARWEARYTGGLPLHRATVAGMLAGDSAFRGVGVERLEELRRLAPDQLIGAPRLAETRAEHQRRALRHDRALAETLAGAQLALGDTSRALSLFDSVALASTDTSLFARIAKIAYARGDTAREVRWLARRAAMPLARDTMAPAHALAPGAWAQLVRDQRAALYALARQGAINARPVGPLTALDGEGRHVTLAADSTMVLVYWSAGCPYSRALLPRLAALGGATRTLGGRLVLVADGAQTDAHVELLRSAKLSEVTALYDADRSIARALSAWAVPKIYVLDRQGILRFLPGDPADVPLALASLEGTLAASPRAQESERR